MPQVSVIIPTFNRRQPLERAICSVTAQSFLDWELIVVDDGSTDESDAFLQSMRGTWGFSQNFLSLKLENSGVSNARNKGAAAAQGQWLAFLDSDDEWMGDKLERQMQLAPGFRWLHGEEHWMRDDRRVTVPIKHRKSGGSIFERCVQVCCVSASTVMIERELFLSLGGFRADFPVCEDYEFWLRLAINHPAGFVAPAVAVKYGGHADQLSRRYHSMDYFRAKALWPFLGDSRLTAAQLALVRETLLEKCEILLNGYRKHGNQEHTSEVLSWRDQALSGSKGLNATP